MDDAILSESYKFISNIDDIRKRLSDNNYELKTKIRNLEEELEKKKDKIFELEKLCGSPVEAQLVARLERKVNELSNLSSNYKSAMDEYKEHNVELEKELDAKNRILSLLIDRINIMEKDISDNFSNLRDCLIAPYMEQK